MSYGATAFLVFSCVKKAVNLRRLPKQAWSRGSLARYFPKLSCTNDLRGDCCYTPELYQQLISQTRQQVASSQGSRMPTDDGRRYLSMLHALQHVGHVYDKTYMYYVLLLSYGPNVPPAGTSSFL